MTRIVALVASLYLAACGGEAPSQPNPIPPPQPTPTEPVTFQDGGSPPPNCGDPYPVSMLDGKVTLWITDPCTLEPLDPGRPTDRDPSSQLANPPSQPSR